MSEELSEKKQEILKEQEDKVEELGKEHIDSQTQKEFLKEQGIEVEEPVDQHINQVIAKIQSEYSGPIPPPNIIKGYEQVLPGSADRILKMAEKQSSIYKIDSR